MDEKKPAELNFKKIPETKQEQTSAKSPEETEKKSSKRNTNPMSLSELYKDQEAVNTILKSAENFAKSKGGNGLKNNGKYDMTCIAQTLYIIMNHFAKREETLKNRIAELSKRLEDMERFKNESGYDSEYQKWKKAQKTGRPPVSVDWEKYDHMVKAGLPQKDILRYLNISGNTLRRKLKEREAPKGK